MQGDMILKERQHFKLREKLCMPKKKFLDDRNIIISVVRDASDTAELCQGNNGLFEQQSSKVLIIASNFRQSL